jgi:hypothetical protein
MRPVQEKDADHEQENDAYQRRADTAQKSVATRDHHHREESAQDREKMMLPEKLREPLPKGLERFRKRGGVDVHRGAEIRFWARTAERFLRAILRGIGDTTINPMPCHFRRIFSAVFPENFTRLMQRPGFRTRPRPSIGFVGITDTLGSPCRRLAYW